MTRIIGGRAGGLRLESPRGDATRPTSERVREAVFSTVESWSGSMHGSRVLDLFAGTGAIGLEAWSRGADAVMFVESDRVAAELIRKNAAHVGCEVADVRWGKVDRVLASSRATEFELVYVDPPYPLSSDDVDQVLAALAHRGWLAVDAMVIVERSARARQPAWPTGLLPGRAKKYGDTRIWYGHADRPEESAPPDHAEPPQE